MGELSAAAAVIEIGLVGPEIESWRNVGKCDCDGRTASKRPANPGIWKVGRNIRVQVIYITSMSMSTEQ
jgi:hypothetical protein